MFDGCDSVDEAVRCKTYHGSDKCNRCVGCLTRNHVQIVQRIGWSAHVKEYFRGLEAAKLKAQREHDPLWGLSWGDDGWQALAISTRLKGIVFYGFMDLPPEIRQRIYKLLLVRGKIFVKNETDGCTGLHYPRKAFLHHRYTSGRLRPRYRDMQDFVKVPLTGSLVRGVSKTIQAEASAVFWGSGNQFILPGGNWGDPWGFEGLAPPHDHCDVHDPNRPPPISDISFAFDMRDSLASTYDICRWREDAIGELDAQRGSHGVYVKYTPAEISSEMHSMKLFHLQEKWQRRCARLQQEFALRKLEIDLEECYCPDGCCRQATFVAQCLAEPWRFGPPPLITFVRWEDDEEKRMILASMRVHAKTNVSFSGESIKDHWEKHYYSDEDPRDTDEDTDGADDD